MDSSYIVLAVPFFFLFIAIELLVNRSRGELKYHLHDSLASLSCGIGQQVLLLFTTGFGLWAYQQLQSRYGLLAISPRSLAAWVALLFLDDFCYYLYHRASHRVNFLWATHIVHHQSEEYNLSTALRQSWFTSLTSWLFYVPLAIIGFPFVMFVTMRTLNTLYQFWIHTRSVDKLGPLEWVLNTPSHHRVHHGIDPRYIDKNHAGIFIIWDRLLGTFRVEDREPVYGTVKPLASFDPVWANFSDWGRLWRMAWQTRRPVDKLRVWFMPPEWRPQDLGGEVVVPEVTRQGQHKYEVPASPAVDVYSLLTFLQALAGGLWFLIAQGKLSGAQRIGVAGEVVLALWTCGVLVEGRRWAWALEAARLVSLGAAALFLPAALRPIGLGLAVGLLGLLLMSYRSRRAAQAGGTIDPATQPQPAAASSR